MSALDDRIDDLYQQPLSAFIGARNALAKSLSKDEAKRVRALAKPTVVPWAVNQVYWRARATYDRLMKSGEQLRKAQIAALEGKAADVRAAGDAHRRAIADAVREAERLAGASGSKPGPDALMRTFEALSVAGDPPEAPGRLTGALQPAGFEALAGVTPSGAPGGPAKGTPHARPPAKHPPANAGHHDGSAARGGRRQPGPVGAGRLQPDRGRADREQTKADREQTKKDRERAAAVSKAEARLARVEAAEQQARAAWERAHDELLEARRALAQVKSTK